MEEICNRCGKKAECDMCKNKTCYPINENNCGLKGGYIKITDPESAEEKIYCAECLANNVIEI